jgi:hypothetical protein
MWPNVVVEWLTLLHIRKIPGSNLGPETGYPHWRFSLISSVPPGECQDSTLKFSHILSMSSFTYHPLVASVVAVSVLAIRLKVCGSNTAEAMDV